MPPVDVTIKTTRRAASGQTLTFPDNIGKHGILFVFKDYKYEQQGRALLNTTRVTTDSILLPLPRQLLDRTGVRVNKADLGLSGELMARAGNSLATGDGTISGIIQGIKDQDFGSKAADALFGAYNQGLDKTAGEIAKQSSYLVRKFLSSIDSNLSAGVDVGTGTTINPRSALVFEGVEMKVHNFDWDLAPTSFQESETLNTMIRVIKRNMLPAFQDLTVGNESTLQRAFLKYPSLVDIFLIGVNADHFFKYKTCMIQDLSVNYSQTGSVAVLKGGKPAIVNIQLSLMEADIHTSSDYGGANNEQIFEDPGTGGRNNF